MADTQGIKERIARLQQQQNDTLSTLQVMGDRLIALRDKLEKQHVLVRKQNTFAESKTGFTLEETKCLDEMTKKVIQDRENICVLLEKENAQLNDCIGQYEATMSVLVQKHKEQLQQVHAELAKEKQSLSKILDAEQENASRLQQSILQLNEQIAKSHEVMRLASEAHEADLIERDNTISRLQAENEGLRQLLQISEVENGTDEFSDAVIV